MQIKHIGRMISKERRRLGFSEEIVCRNLCDLDVYNRIEDGKGNADIHLIRIILQRLGMNANLAGRYLVRDEYDEIKARYNILEYLKENKLRMAKEALNEYVIIYNKTSKFNRQFSSFISARIAEIEENYQEALLLYNKALKYSFGIYKLENIVCISAYEYFILANIARLNNVIGNNNEAEIIYNNLLAYCNSKKNNYWLMASVYPKTVCEILQYIHTPQNMGNYDRKKWLEECDAAINILRKSGRAHFIKPLIYFRHTLLCLLDEKDLSQWDEFLVHYQWLQNRYDTTEELLTWFPYYNSDWDIYQVEKMIDERRKIYGITIEELADGVCAPETLSRIINRRISPKYSTIEALLDKLELRGVLSENIIVSEDNEAYRILDTMVHCQSVGDYITSAKLYYKLKEMIDYDIPINKKLLDYKFLELDTSKASIEYYSLALFHENILGMPIEKIKELSIFTRVELLIINRFYYYMDKTQNYTYLSLYEDLCKKALNEFPYAFARDFEGVITRCASYLGNTGNYHASNYYSNIGINLELRCERFYCLSSLLYCIPWNKVTSGEIPSDNDILMCKCAYWIAYFLGEKERMNLYQNWLNKYCKQ